MPTETYSAARKRLLADLASKGWKVVADLKVLYATSPDGAYPLDTDPIQS